VRPAPDVRPTSGARALGAPALAAGLGLGAAALLHLRDPHDSGSYGFCPFLAVTGLPCPGCGGLRAVNDLTRGDVVGALGSNAAAVLVVVAAVVLWGTWVARRLRGPRDAPAPSLSTRGGLAVLAALLAFGVLRVTPWGAWLAP
jgi:hypothetical protein